MKRTYTEKDKEGQKSEKPTFHKNDIVIVKVKPGTAAEKSMKFRLPDNLADGSVDSIIKYAINLREEDGLKREDTRIQERVEIEMQNRYGISVNGQAVDGKASISELLKEAATAGGIRYLEAEIIIASRQEGAGLEYRL